MHLSVEIARQTRQLPKTPDMMNTPKMGLAQYSGSEDWASTLDMILDVGYGIWDMMNTPNMGLAQYSGS